MPPAGFVAAQPIAQGALGPLAGALVTRREADGFELNRTLWVAVPPSRLEPEPRRGDYVELTVTARADGVVTEIDDYLLVDRSR